MGAVLPARPSVDARGLEWIGRGQWWWSAVWAGTSYHVTFNQRGRDSWDVLFSDGLTPFRTLTGPAADVVVQGLVAWLAAQGHEVPQAPR